MKAMLESKKTLSNKAKQRATSHQGSRANSRRNSPASSRTASVAPSDVDDESVDGSSVGDVFDRDYSQYRYVFLFVLVGLCR